MFVAFEKHANHSHLLICILLIKHHLLIQVEEALKILMAYCSLGEEYQVDYLLKRIKHWLHLRRIKKPMVISHRCMWRKRCPAVLTVSGRNGLSSFCLDFHPFCNHRLSFVLSASDIIPVLGVVVFHLCTVNNVSV